VNIETRMLQTLADLLGVDVQQISSTMHFGELGLDSLLGLRFARKIGELTNVEIDLEWIFDYPTVRDLSGFLEHQAVSLAA
jgi:acyl carrier protein